MDPFVRRLVRRLNDPGQPLSRNRHFHTFETPEGRQALRLHRRLRALQRQVLACRAEGGEVRLGSVGSGSTTRLELSMERLSGRLVSFLKPGELELLLELEGVRAALGAPDLQLDAVR